MPIGTLAVITDAGDVFGVNVAGHDLGPRFQFGGGRQLGFNPQDRFMVVINNVPGGVLA